MFEFELKSDGLAEVYLPTLAPFRAKADGTMSLSGIKKMSASEGFLGIDASFRGCGLQSFEECQTEELLRICGCLPWGFSPALPKKVMFHALNLRLFLSSGFDE